MARLANNGGPAQRRAAPDRRRATTPAGWPAQTAAPDRVRSERGNQTAGAPPPRRSRRPPARRHHRARERGISPAAGQAAAARRGRWPGFRAVSPATAKMPHWPAGRSKPRSTCSSPDIPMAELLGLRQGPASSPPAPSADNRSCMPFTVHRNAVRACTERPAWVTPSRRDQPCTRAFVNLRFLEDLDAPPPQRHHGSESGLGTRTCGSLGQPPRCTQLDTHAVKLA